MARYAGKGKVKVVTQHPGFQLYAAAKQWSQDQPLNGPQAGIFFLSFLFIGQSEI
jgi:hypothetical protein